MHQALYRKWRPVTFDEVCGQEHITSILKYEIDNSKFSHAYLFCGSRGTGKTTCAKILSKAVNCLSPVNGNPCCKCEACLSIETGSATDVLEMDAASNNGVDNIRDIRDEVVYAPSSLKYRVYIIDEVHMLSTSAFNALLKTLEEPPEHVVFILATTELHKLPATIISRCQRFDFRRITTEVLKNRLMYIASHEGIDLCEDAAIILAKQAQGGMRDAISLLELCAGSHETITPKLVNMTIGSSGRDEMLRVAEAVCDKDYETILASVDEVVRSSRDITVFWQDLISVYRDLLIIKTSKNAAAYLDLTDSEIKVMSKLAQKFSGEQLSSHCSMLEDALFSMLKANSIRRIVAELTLVKMCDLSLSTTNEALLARISALEYKIVGVEFVQKNEVPAEPSAEKKNTRAVKTDEDDEMFRSDAPAKKKSSESVTKQQNENHGMRQYKNRSEVLDKLTDSNSMLASFYKSAKWYVDGDKIILRFSDEYSANSAKLFDSKGEFARIASSVSGVKYAPSDILYEIGQTNEDDTSLDALSDFDDN